MTGSWEEARRGCAGLGGSQPTPCCLPQRSEAKRGRREGEAEGSPERGQEEE